MNPKALIVCASSLVLAVGAAQARTHADRAGRYAEPAQPIAYAKLGDYLKTSPRQRASQDWSGGMATASAAGAPGAAVDTSATSPAPQAAPGAPAAQPPGAQPAATPAEPNAAPSSGSATAPPNANAPPSTTTAPASGGSTTGTPGGAVNPPMNP
jgi:hypothetical protein